MSADPKSSYYDVGGIETIDVIRAKLGPKGFTYFCLGNIIKYASRAMHKGSMLRDIEKVSVYSQLLQENINETAIEFGSDEMMPRTEQNMYAEMSNDE